jgi:hypothetical protein
VFSSAEALVPFAAGATGPLGALPHPRLHPRALASNKHEEAREIDIIRV